MKKRKTKRTPPPGKHRSGGALPDAAFDPMAWAAQHPSAGYRGPKCLICKSKPVFEKLSAIVAAIDDGRLANYTVVGCLPWITEEEGIPVTSSSLHRCVREHIRRGRDRG